MKMPSYRLIVRARRILWGLIIAYMLGVHNFYKGEDKALDDIIKSAHTIEQNEVLEDDAPKNWKAHPANCPFHNRAHRLSDGSPGHFYMRTSEVQLSSLRTDHLTTCYQTKFVYMLSETFTSLSHLSVYGRHHRGWWGALQKKSFPRTATHPRPTTIMASMKINL